MRILCLRCPLQYESYGIHTISRDFAQVSLSIYPVKKDFMDIEDGCFYKIPIKAAYLRKLQH